MNSKITCETIIKNYVNVIIHINEIMCFQKQGEIPKELNYFLKYMGGNSMLFLFLCTHLNYPARYWTPSGVYLISTFPCPHSDVQRLQTDRAKRSFVYCFETIRNFLQLPVGRTRSSPVSCVWMLLT